MTSCPDESSDADCEREVHADELDRAILSSVKAQETGIAATIIGLMVANLGCNVLGVLSVGPLLVALLFSAIISIPVGVITGGLAHTIFFKTTISVKLMTIVFSLIASFTMVGWALVVMETGAGM